VPLLPVRYIKPIIRERAIVNLLAAAGMTQGIGDYRQEKGAGAYGCFRLAGADDAELGELMQYGRAAQVAALAHPEPYDTETRDLLAWFDVEVQRRGFEDAAAKHAAAAITPPDALPRKRRSRKNGDDSIEARYE